MLLYLPGFHVLMGIERVAGEVREFLNERLEIFPYRCCKFAARELHSRGLSIVVGFLKLDMYGMPPGDFDMLHYWNRDVESGLDVDITASGYNIYLSPEKRLPGIHIWKPCETDMFEVIRDNLRPDQII